MVAALLCAIVQRSLVRNTALGGAEGAPSVRAPRLALVVSFWDTFSAKRTTASRARHANETLAAIVMNSVNCHFDIVHILYETDKEHCVDILREVNSLRRALKSQCGVKVSCEPRNSRASYADMFLVTKRSLFKSHVTIVANADQVFDSSVGLLRSLQADELSVIATRGLSEDNTPKELLAMYEDLTRSSVQSILYAELNITKLDEFTAQTGLDLRPTVTNRCYTNAIRFSWDAYAFHPVSIKIRMDYFLQPNRKVLFMNQLGAENIALRALVQASHKLKKVTQSCDQIHMWHFHVHPKTHDDTWAVPVTIKPRTFEVDNVQNKLCHGGFAPC